MSLTHTAWFSLAITRISGSKPFCHQRHILIMLSYAERRFEPAGIRFRLRQLYWSQGGQFICSLPGQYIEPRSWDYEGGNHDGDFTHDKQMIGCQRKIPHDNHSKLIQLQSSLRSFVSHSSLFWSESHYLLYYLFVSHTDGMSMCMFYSQKQGFYWDLYVWVGINTYIPTQSLVPAILLKFLENRRQRCPLLYFQNLL